MLIDTLAIQSNRIIVSVFPGDRNGYFDGIAHLHSFMEVQVLGPIHTSRPRQLGAHYPRNQSAAPHIGSQHLIQHIVRDIPFFSVGRVNIITPQHGKQFDILIAEGTHRTGGITNPEFVKGFVFDAVHGMSAGYCCNT